MGKTNNMDTIAKEIAYVLIFFTMSFAFTPLGGIIAIVLLLFIENIDKKRQERKDTERFMEMMHEEERRHSERCAWLIEHYGV